MKTPFHESLDEQEEQLDAFPTEPYLRPTRRGRFRRFVRTSALLAALVVGAGGAVVGLLYWRNVSAPIDVETASTGRLVGWLALRDLSAETPETRARLFERYVETLGDENGGVEPEKIEIPESAKRIANVFFAKRADAKTSTKPAPAERLPILRLDYRVAPRAADSPIASDFVLSDEVRPGPALLERWNASREARERGDVEKTSAVEKNIRLLVMQWFVAKRRAYDAAPDAEKEAFLAATVDELLGWQGLYDKIQTDATKANASRAALLAEFEKTVASWNEFAEPEELAKTLWFKDLIVATIAAQETPLGRFAPPKPPRARKLASEESPRSPAARDFGARTLDAARRFFFETAETAPDADAPSR